MSKDRLANLRRLLKAEQASDNPSKLYIVDLKLTIKWLMDQVDKPAYEMVSGE